MTADPDVLAGLRHYVSEEILEGNDVGLAPTTPLLELGVLNSMEIFRLTSFIERRFAVVVPDEEIRVENLKDLASIAKLVCDLRARRSG